jgi:hypothetical protein
MAKMESHLHTLTSFHEIIPVSTFPVMLVTVLISHFALFQSVWYWRKEPGWFFTTAGLVAATYCLHDWIYFVIFYLKQYPVSGALSRLHFHWNRRERFLN